jgi:hypothetical protein
MKTFPMRATGPEAVFRPDRQFGSLRNGRMIRPLATDDMAIGQSE